MTSPASIVTERVKYVAASTGCLSTSGPMRFPLLEYFPRGGTAATMSILKSFGRLAMHELFFRRHHHRVCFLFTIFADQWFSSRVTLLLRSVFGIRHHVHLCHGSA